MHSAEEPTAAPAAHGTPDALGEELEPERAVRLLSGSGYWTTRAEPAMGLRSMLLSDGASGVRGERWDDRDPSICPPAPVGMAATWDPDLVARLAGLLAEEARRKHVDIVLGPTLNLQRSPLAGRHFECFSEDPLLAGRMGVAYVRGLQDRGVAATAKHFVANDSETNRFSVDVRVDERTLREVYLAAFERVVVDGGVWAVMAAYNSVNGVTMTENPLLLDPLVREWGFDGVVVSDWYATRSAEPAVRAGLGLVMPGPDDAWHDEVVAAVQAGSIPREEVIGAARRLLRLAARVGAGPASAGPVPAAGPATAEDVSRTCREAATASMVLLHDDGAVLPLDRRRLGRVAVLGPNAADGLIQGGGTATVVPQYSVSPVEGLRYALGPDVEVLAAAGVHDDHLGTPLPAGRLTCPSCGEPGLAVRYLDEAGQEVRREHRFTGHLVWFGDDIVDGATVEVSARLEADAPGAWHIGFCGVGPCRLSVDGDTLIDEVVVPRTDSFASSFLDPPQRAVDRWMDAGEGVDVVLLHQLLPAQRMASLTFGVQRPRRPATDEFAVAVDLAGRADAVVLVVDSGRHRESEGFDRPSMRLPAGQDDLVRAVASVNPRTIVVVNAGAPVAMPWRDRVAAVLVAGFPGQEFGNALADVLLGASEPGGRLPTTWAARDEDVPVLSTRPVDGRLHYDEGVHVGYRAWLRAGTAPAYPFGHGLGYTSWSYLAIEAPSTLTADEDVAVRVRVRNTGGRPGREVVQVYLSRAGSAVERPAAWLAGFGLVHAGPGEEAVALVPVSARAFQHWSVREQGWVTEAGAFRVAAGRSVGDLRLGCDIRLAG
jgi:beta-glucosidase